jgi:ABC-type amino acid transport substrate-binding protein
MVALQKPVESTAPISIRVGTIIVKLMFIGMILLISSGLSAASNIVKVGVYENSPKIFTDQSGHPTGIFIDIISEIAAQEGWELQFVPGTWDEGMQRLQKGEIDLMPDVAYTSERAQTMDFHQVPVLSSWSQVFTRQNTGIHSILDLNGKRVALLDGSVQQKAFAGMADGFGMKVQLIGKPTYEAVFKAVQDGSADAAVTNNLYGLTHAGSYRLEDTAVVFNPSLLFFAAHKGMNEDILNTIDNQLDAMKKNPQSVYYRTLRQWVSPDNTLRFPLWMKVTALMLVVVLVVSLFSRSHSPETGSSAYPATTGELSGSGAARDSSYRRTGGSDETCAGCRQDQVSVPGHDVT